MIQENIINILSYTQFMDIKDKRLKSKYLVRKIFTPNIRDQYPYYVNH